MLVEKYNKIILFGGGRALLKFAVEALKLKLKFVIFTEGHHLQEKINTFGTLKENLENRCIPYISCTDITKIPLQKYIDERTLGFSMSALWIFKKEIIEMFKGRLYNLHIHRLPINKGAGGFTWSILSGNRIGGITIHKLEDGIDTGDIVLQNRFIFPSCCRIPADYYDYCEKKENQILMKFLNSIKKGEKFKAIHQLKHLSTYWPRLNTQINGFINWEWESTEIELFINAFDDPYKGTATFLNGKKVHLKKCFRDKNAARLHPFQGGLIYRVSPKSIYVAARGGGLIIGNVVDSYGKEMIGQVKAGSRFHTPASYLEKAKISRITYGPEGLKIKL